MDERETENMNPEEIYNSIKQMSADIQVLINQLNSFIIYLKDIKLF